MSFTGSSVFAGMLKTAVNVHAGASDTSYKVIAFDAFSIFDLRPVSNLAELFPGKSTNLMSAWRTRQFEYQWLRILSNKYVDFWQITEDSLEFASKKSELQMTSETRNKLMSTYSHLSVWPDVQTSLCLLHNAGVRLGFLSNMTKKMLEFGLERANLNGTFEPVLSTDQIKTYKPTPLAYQMATNAFVLARHEILFVPFASWDMAVSFIRLRLTSQYYPNIRSFSIS